MDPPNPDTTQESLATTPTVKVEVVLAWGPPLRLMVWPVKTLVSEVPPASVSVRVAV